MLLRFWGVIIVQKFHAAPLMVQICYLFITLRRTFFSILVSFPSEWKNSLKMSKIWYRRATHQVST